MKSKPLQLTRDAISRQKERRMKPWILIGGFLCSWGGGPLVCPKKETYRNDTIWECVKVMLVT
jgi:hypothetical protein